MEADRPWRLYRKRENERERERERERPIITDEDEESYPHDGGDERL